VDSTQGVGSNFDIFLPIVEEKSLEPVQESVDVGIISTDETFVYSVKTFCSGMGLSAKDETEETLSKAKIKALIIDGDTCESITKRIISGDIKIDCVVLVATEDLEKWDGKDKVRFFRKPFGAWSVYTALSDIIPNESKPLRTAIEVTQESK
jgi:hypothetical protein